MERALLPTDVIRAVRDGFVAYSRGQTIIPPVGELLFADPPGDCHLKYGYRIGDATFTVKIATGFPENAKRGLQTSNGVIVVFSSHTGAVLAILQDEGFLTDIRTAAAGAVAAKLLAPSEVEMIGIIGAGTQGRLQLEYLREVLPTRKAMLWTRSRERANAYSVDGFEISIAASIDELAAKCRLIVTTTPARDGLLSAFDVHPGTHITAVGADGAGKRELDPELFRKAAVCAVDSRTQCAQFGDSSYAIRQGLIRIEDLVELGELIDGARPGRDSDTQITIADLTGVAIQDIEVAKLTLQVLGAGQHRQHGWTETGRLAED